jgi:hypothetical protein
MTLPTSTTNITGLRIMVRALNFLSASTSAWRTILASHNDLDLVSFAIDSS